MQVEQPAAELTQRAYQQAWLFGAKYVLVREVRRLRARGADRVLTLSDGRDITARAVVIATGARYRRLDVPDLAAYEGSGVHYWASPLEAKLCGGQDVLRHGHPVIPGPRDFFLIGIAAAVPPALLGGPAAASAVLAGALVVAALMTWTSFQGGKIRHTEFHPEPVTSAVR